MDLITFGAAQAKLKSSVDAEVEAAKSYAKEATAAAQEATEDVKQISADVDKVETLAANAQTAATNAQTAATEAKAAVEPLKLTVNADGETCQLDEPVLTDETAAAIGKALEIQNGYMSMVAGGKRKALFDDISQISHVVQSNTVEALQKLIPIGNQIIVPWKDLDDSAHNTDDTAYQVAWDVVNIAPVTKQNGDVVPGLWLQMHKCSTYGVQFSNCQAFYNATNGLAAGTYYVTFNTTWGAAKTGESMNFTLNQAVPAGGKLSGFQYIADGGSSFTVKSWATADAANPIETVTAKSGVNGTSLGIIEQRTVSTDGLNGLQQVAYGHNRYSTSAIRQYLNATGTGWWTSQEDFDIRPDQYSKHGFMSGFGDDFLAALKPVKVTTLLNTVEGFSMTSEDTYDKFFLPALEQMYVTPQATGEGDYWPYWKERLGLGKPAGQWTAHVAYKTVALNSDSPQNIRLRSALRSYAYNAWFVFSSGFVSDGSACTAFRFSPACVIC